MSVFDHLPRGLRNWLTRGETLDQIVEARVKAVYHHPEHGIRTADRFPEPGEQGYFEVEEARFWEAGERPRGGPLHHDRSPIIQTWPEAWGPAGQQQIYMPRPDLTRPDFTEMRGEAGRVSGRGHQHWGETQPQHWVAQIPQLGDPGTFVYQGRVWRGLPGAEGTVEPGDPVAHEPGFWRNLFDRFMYPDEPGGGGSESPRHHRPYRSYDPDNDPWVQGRRAAGGGCGDPRCTSC